MRLHCWGLLSETGIFPAQSDFVIFSQCWFHTVPIVAHLSPFFWKPVEWDLYTQGYEMETKGESYYLG